MSIPLHYVVVNCQERAKYRRKSDGKITGFSLAKTEEIRDMDAEIAKVEWFVPQISKEGRKRIEEVFSNDPVVEVKFDYIGRRIAERKYLKPGEEFSVPKTKKLARVTVSKLPATEQGFQPAAEVDRILGFPDFRAEKPYYVTKD